MKKSVCCKPVIYRVEEPTRYHHIEGWCSRTISLSQHYLAAMISSDVYTDYIILPNLSIFTHFPEEPRHQSTLVQAISHNTPKRILMNGLTYESRMICPNVLNSPILTDTAMKPRPLPAISHALNQCKPTPRNSIFLHAAVRDTVRVHTPEFPHKKEKKKVGYSVIPSEFYNPASTLVLFVESHQTVRVWTTLYDGYL